MELNQKGWWIVGIVLALFLLFSCCCGCGVTGWALWQTAQEVEWDVTPLLTTVEPGEEETSTATPVAVEVPPQALENLEAVQQSDVPPADLHELGIRFRGVDPNTPRVASTTNPDYPVGTVRRFTVSDADADKTFEIEAELVYKTPHVYVWVEKGVEVDERRLKKAADLFETHTYPTDREFFGSEWTPGVDGDPHISILHARGLGDTVAGYFSSPDEYVKAVRPDSNEMEMFYINIENVTIGDDFYNGVLAHEFQHMIHWYNDRNEETWLNEGCSDLAMDLNNRRYPGHYDVGGSDYAYMLHPDTQLDSWPEGTAGNAAAHYGASYLFMAYFLDRFGEQATMDLVAQPENGMESVDLTLRDLDMPADYDHRALFADWVVANFVDAPDFGDGRYGYRSVDPSRARIDVSYDEGDFPPDGHTSSVHQYGVDYVEVEGDHPFTFRFQGDTLVKLMDTDAHSGDYLWWSNRADESDTRLSRIVDLRGASEARVDFWSWYYIEEDWDYAYVVVGTTDEGRIPDDLSDPAIHWQILDDPSLHCTTSNPNDNAYGCGFTGKSNGWQHLEADLTPFVGQEIVLRFEMITDAAVNQPGFALDDITLTVDGQVRFSDDVESGEGEWIAEGFLRHSNILPEEWIVQAILLDGNRLVEVRPLLMADGTEGEWTIPLGENDVDRVVFTLSALAPVTTEPAHYTFWLEEAP